ncbi:hypothetical protein PINS_up005565 [Pythium insidiosum]|nr:hypothetical protein PINS_up005565 [Pythium insidiosum]
MVTKDLLKTSMEFEETIEPIAIGASKSDAQQARDDAENAKADAAQTDSLIRGIEDLDDSDDDDEPTEKKIARLSEAQCWNWRHFVAWFFTAAGLLCAIDVAMPFIVYMLSTRLPVLRCQCGCAQS